MRTLLALTAMCGLMLSTTLRAQTQTLTAAQQKQVSDELKRFGADLNLSSTQLDKLRPILGDQLLQTHGVRTDATLTNTQKAQKINEIRAANRPKIEAILSPDQMQKWDAEVAKLKNMYK